jgi:hypothetical protein
MRRISIRTLMAFVLVSAVGLAALRNADELWAGMMLLLALASVGVAILGAALMKGRERAWWLGFAVFGGGYLVAALCPLWPQLGTTHLLDYVHARVVGSEIATVEVSRFDQSSVLYRLVTTDGGVSERTIANSVYNSTSGKDLLATMEPANRWRSALPGAADREPFLRVGQCLFALLAGLLGATVATWFWKRRESGQ